MSYNAKKILIDLIQQYERSIVSKQGTSRNIKQRFNITKKNLPDYFKVSGYSYRNQLNHDLFSYEENGWIEIEYDKDLESISSIILNHERVMDIYKFLDIKPKKVKEKELIDLFRKYLYTDIHGYVIDVITKIENYESYSSLVFDNIEDNKNLLMTIDEMLKLNHEEMERNFSVRVLKDSKKFQKIKSKVIHILKLYFDANGEEDEILSDFNIMKNPGSISIKGKGTILIKNSRINLEDFGKEFIISSSNIQYLKIEELPVKKIMTVENLTSFYSINLEDTLFIYLGGYHNHYRRKLLQLIYEKYPNKEYYHFGDIDAGGIYIFEHLRNKTQIPFKPYLMNIEILKKYNHQAIPLTKNDVDRLNKINIKEFDDLIKYMIDHNQKLEQENINEYNVINI